LIKNCALSDFSNDNLISMSRMFFHCSALETLDLSQFKTPKVEDMSYAFADCSKIKKLDFWPPNSPDLSPIECVWAEVQKKLEGYTFKKMDDFRKKIVYEWNRVPVEYCQRICRKFMDDIQQIYKFGRIKEKHHISKGGLIFKQKGIYTDEIENIVFNKVSLRNVIKFNINHMK